MPETHKVSGKKQQLKLSPEWREAQRRCRLSAEAVRMARAMGKMTRECVSLRLTSYARPGKLLTANQTLIVSEGG